MVRRGRVTAVTIVMMGRDSPCPPMAELTWLLQVFLNTPRPLQNLALILEYRNAKKVNCKIKFRYSFLTKTTTNLPVMVSGRLFRGASSARG